ncbi:MAG: MBL fold metallo-hydrolase [Desulfatibacillaceae bacterium]
MFDIKQFRYGADNLAYLLYNGQTAMAVDGGAVQEILDFVSKEGLRLETVTNTHGHPDHTTGSARLVEATGARRLDPMKLHGGEGALIGKEDVEIIHTPGHTRDSVCFLAGRYLVSGDTLFNGTVGNPFSGDLAAFYHSVKRLMTLPPETVVFAGHDYVEESMAFARYVEPENQDNIDAYLADYDPVLVRSTIADELLVNPYLRFNEPAIVAMLERRGLSVNTEYDRWLSLMSVE